ncbi:MULTISPECIES: hypothetical protein [unclassified Bradyrhizobium]|uniref:hypothetical protein n=1 Tax=unclassified Bradyrhizobium TaxID=2631580 RepID=UPI0033978826
MRYLIDTPTHSYDGSRASFIDARTIDDIIDPIEMFAPLSADSSRIAAVAAQRDADHVLFGPPDPGKSQTIANAITNCVAVAPAAHRFSSSEQAITARPS